MMVKTPKFHRLIRDVRVISLFISPFCGAEGLAKFCWLFVRNADVIVAINYTNSLKVFT